LPKSVGHVFGATRIEAPSRPLLAFAAYNAAPASIIRMRAEAAQRGLDTDHWFNSVEIVVAEKMGMQTPTYVRNIYIYNVSYRLVTEARSADAPASGTAGK
jgi:membrane-bound lytic murein transglycosylase MltF